MNNKNSAINYVWIIVSMLSLFIIDATSIVSYIYTLLLVLIINKYVIKEWSIKILNHFHYYLFISILLYLTHKFFIPSYIGLSGPEGGIGTDDCRYYTQLVNGAVPFNNTYHLVPVYFSFTYFLDFIYPFSIHTPLNIIIVNLLGVIYLPSIIRQFTTVTLNSEVIAHKAELFTLLCPFTTYYGCIIMRDMWTTSLILLALVMFSNKRYLSIIPVIALICFIRFGTMVFLGMGLLVLYREKLYSIFQNKAQGRLIFAIFIVITILGFIVAFPMLQTLSGGRLQDGLFRANFVEKLIDMNSAGAILKLMSLPFPLSTIGLTTLFFLQPFLSFEVYYLSTLSVMRLFAAPFTAIFFMFLWKSIFKSIFYSVRDQRIRTIVYIAILFALCLGTVSLQPRHKTTLMPILCILAAIGFNLPKKSFNIISSLIAFVFISWQIINSII